MRLRLTAALLLLPLTASAHAILVQSQPPADTTIAPGPTKIVLRYNSRIDQARSRLSLRGTNAEMTLPLTPGTPTDQLAADGDFTPGTYVLHWQVLAVDGHMTRGDVRFTVQRP